jgi:hypothetical protein
MPGKESPPRRPARRRLLLLLFLLLALLLLPLSRFLAGVLEGGGRRPDEGGSASPGQGGLLVTVLRGTGGPPVAGARILLRTADGACEERTTDASGRASLPRLPGESVRVEATGEGRRSAARIDPSGGPTLELPLLEGDTIGGRVTDARGAPREATVRLLDERCAILAETRSDRDGRYLLPRHPEATSVCAEDGSGAAGAAEEGDIRLSAEEPVSGRLLGAAGGDLDIHALWTPPDGDRRLPLRLRVPVGPDGSFATRLPRGAEAWALHRGLPVRLGAGGSALPATTPLRGRVAGPDGAPARGARLLLRPLLDRDFPAPLPPLRIVAAEDGTFSASVPSVRYRVEVRARGCATAVVDWFEPVREAISIRLERGLALAGVVLDAGGAPVAGALVSAGTERAFSDAEGRFLLEGMPGDRARWTATAAGFAPESGDAGDGAPLRIVLRRG